jgi:DNA-binding NarL/FixJ family response regulator
MADRLRAVVAEDSALLRRGIEQSLVDAGFDVVACTADADQLLDEIQAAGHRVDVAVVDIKMPPTFTDEGIRLLETLHRGGSRVGVLLLSMYLDPSYAVRALADGHRGVGYLLKDRIVDTDQFVDAVTRVARGGSAVDPEVVTSLARRPAKDAELRQLTDRERDVLRLVAEGRSNRSIAELLCLTDKTVETHIRHVFQKLGLAPTDSHHRRVLAVLKWLEL